jgi:hypothetical protein
MIFCRKWSFRQGLKLEMAINRKLRKDASRMREPGYAIYRGRGQTPGTI